MNHIDLYLFYKLNVARLFFSKFQFFFLGCFTCCTNNGPRIYNVDPLVEKCRLSKLYFNLDSFYISNT